MCVCACVCVHAHSLYLTFRPRGTVNPPVHEILRPEHWNGLPPTQGITFSQYIILICLISSHHNMGDVYHPLISLPGTGN